MKRIIFIFILLLANFFVITYFVRSYDLPKWFPFNEENAINEWREKIFKNKVLYTVNVGKSYGFLEAKSARAASGLFYKIKFHPKELPMISWKWKVSKFPEKGISTDEKQQSRDKDDYAGRVYVIFPSWNFMKIECIEYIWEENLKEETIITSPYSDKIKLIVAESGRGNMGKWVFEERNIYEDYRTVFGRLPGRYVGAIALMTDTDNTMSTAEAAYTDIKVGYK